MSVKDVVFHSNDLAAVLIHQQGVGADPHPDRPIRRRRQVINAVIAQPVIAPPEGGGQEFAEGPAMVVPAGGATIVRAAEAARGAEVAMKIAEVAVVAALAVITTAIAVAVVAALITAITAIVAAPIIIAAIIAIAARCGVCLNPCGEGPRTQEHQHDQVVHGYLDQSVGGISIGQMTPDKHHCRAWSSCQDDAARNVIPRGKGCGVSHNEHALAGIDRHAAGGRRNVAQGIH